MQRRHARDSGDGGDPADPHAKDGPEYHAMMNQLALLNLGGLLQLADVLEKKRSLFGVALSSVDTM